MPSYFWIPISILALGGMVFGLLFFMSEADWKKRKKIEAAVKSVDTPYGLFKYQWLAANSASWETDIDVGPSYVTLEVPDKDGAPDPEQLARIPAVLAVLPSLIAQASANTDLPEHVSAEYLMSIELGGSADEEKDLTLSFANGEDDTGVYVTFRGEELLGELAVD